MTKRIQYSRETHDFDAYLNDEYIGSFPSYLDAETALNELAYEQLRRAA